MFPIIRAIGVLITIYISSYYVKLFRNYLQARKTGLPLIISPIDPNSILWLLISIPLRPTLKRYLPYWLYVRIAMGIYGWEFHEKRIVFRTLETDTFMLVSCGKNELYTIDPDFVADILKRPLDFDKAEVVKVFAGVLGPSLFTAVGEPWARQRKLVTSIINERISRVVFDETWRQGRMMVKDINEVGGIKEDRINHGGITSDSKATAERSEGTLYPTAFPSMKRIASNVLFHSAYGLPQEFKEPPQTSSAESSGAKSEMGMLECINSIIANVIIASALPLSVMLKWPSFLPAGRYLNGVGRAVTRYPVMVRERLQEERVASEKAKRGEGEVRSNLTSMLIQASEFGEHGDHAAKDKKEQQALSEDELRGNLFVFTAAGFETTANALTYALCSLMAQPHLQDWICEEIDELFKNVGDDGPIDYAAFYPKATRCLALMFEVLRLYPPIVHLARGTPVNKSVTISANGKNLWLPPDAFVYVPFLSLHTDPKVWRGLNLHNSDDKAHPIVKETIEDVYSMKQDEYKFRPSRWISPELKRMPDGSMAQTYYQPPRATFTPFSGGPRICPGQKMSQVEFVGVMLALFKDYKIEAVKLPGESETALQQRLKGILDDSHSEMTMVMGRLHEVQVKFLKREKLGVGA